MKNKILKLAYISVVTLGSTVAFTSCDGENQTKVDPSSADALAAIAESLENLENGDLIFYETNNFTDPFQASITLAGDSTTVGDVNYLYGKSGDHEFTLTVTTNAQNALQVALDNVLTGSLSNTLASRLREILRKPDSSTLTNAEYLEVLQILNPSGSLLQLNDAGDGLRAPDRQVYSHTITSTTLDRRRGSIGGLVSVETFGFDVIFRTATVEEAARYREFEGSLIPVLASESFQDTSDEVGTFGMTLINPAN